jgi:hypothetical protein
MNRPPAESVDQEQALEWRRAFEETGTRLRAVSESLRRPDPAEMRRTAEELIEIVRGIEWLADVQTPG